MRHVYLIVVYLCFFLIEVIMLVPDIQTITKEKPLLLYFQTPSRLLILFALLLIEIASAECHINN